MNTIYILLIMILVIILLGIGLYFAFKSIKSKNKEIKELKAEMERLNQNVSVLTEFVKEQKFDRLGVFTYSEEDGTAAASEFSDVVPQEVKDERAERIMEIQQEISLQSNLAKVGKTFRVLIDYIEDDMFVGRTEFDSVEVDNEVLFPYSDKYKIGDFVNVKIDDASEYELYGRVEN